MHPAKILVFGDSYANFKRFDSAIVEACAKAGLNAEVRSCSIPGADSEKLYKVLQDDERLAREHTGLGSADAILLIAGINDVLKRRGASHYRKSMLALQNSAKQISPCLFVLDIPLFDENARLSRSLSRLVRSKFFEFFRDPKPNRVWRYRAALQLLDVSYRIDIQEFMPVFDRKQFKDGVHLTNEAFKSLATFVGEKMSSELAKED